MITYGLTVGKIGILRKLWARKGKRETALEGHEKI